MKFECLPGCALCCHYRIFLSPDDVEKIRLVAKSDDFWVKDSTEGKRVMGYLQRNEGHCIFLSKERLCSIYPQRPLYCHLYPFIEEVYFHSEIDVDLSCPGLNYGKEVFLSRSGETFGEELDFKVSSSLKKRVKSTVDKLEGLLKQRDCYTSKKLCSFMARSLIEDSLKKGTEEGVFLFQERVNLCGSLMRKMGNIMKVKQAKKLMDQLFEKQIFLQKDIPTRAFLKKEFSQPVLNTKISKRKATVYSIKFDAGLMKWSFSDTSQSIELSKLKEIETDDEGRNLLLAYMTFWMRRQLLFRLAYSYALTDFRARNYLFFYLQFLAEVLLRIHFLVRVIAIKERKSKANLPEIKEAIRASDSILRRRCQAKIEIREIANG